MARGRRTPARQARRERTSARDQALAAGRADLWTLCASARAFEWRLACKGGHAPGLRKRVACARRGLGATSVLTTPRMPYAAGG